jgi:hypothetical protein
MYDARLSCGVVLSYEVRTFAPSRGEAVPCRRHGYCLVEHVSRTHTTGRRRREVSRVRRRSEDELLEWLGARTVATVSALRRQGFTLRIVAGAERRGLVACDLEIGTVALAGGRRKPGR